LSYVSYAELESRLPRDQAILGAVAFGRHPPAVGQAAFPFVRIDMPALRVEGVCEIWESGQPVERVESQGFRAACNRHVLFGALQVAEDADMEAAGRLAYRRVFAGLDALGFPYLLRAWNYFPAINDAAGGVERYRSFNVGRQDAFVTHARTVGVDTPAACALGCRAGPLTVYFIAGKARGQPVENPRQVSAYRYPERYGPRTPTFSRAMLIQPDGQPMLAISGTASIVGHETRHVGDVDAQIEETLANIAAVMNAAGHAVSPSPGAGEGLLLKAYLRRPADLPTVESAIAQTFGKAGVVYLHADICRSELLVEIEGLFAPPRSG
jgi:enamine deaminase RidA (YjgF/YER057c/UK114 family)